MLRKCHPHCCKVGHTKVVLPHLSTSKPGSQVRLLLRSLLKRLQVSRTELLSVYDLLTSRKRQSKPGKWKAVLELLGRYTGTDG